MRLFPVAVRGARSLLALSSRPWLGYSDMGTWSCMPLSYEALDHAAVRCAALHCAARWIFCLWLGPLHGANLAAADGQPVHKLVQPSKCDGMAWVFSGSFFILTTLLTLCSM